MSEDYPAKVFMSDGDDPEMDGASAKARATFRYFWRELAWENRRIIPALQLACVKAPFQDVHVSNRPKDKPQVEHMWLNEVNFDGEFVDGFLLNSPNWLKSINAGDPVRLPLAEVADWMYVIGGDVYDDGTPLFPTRRSVLVAWRSPRRKLEDPVR